jgi:hypothetical protein
MPPTPFCSPHADKVPFCYVLELLEMAEKAGQIGEKETFNIGLNEHGIALLIGRE